MTPAAGVLMLGRGHLHVSRYSEYLSSTLSIYSTLIAFVFRNCDAAFLYHYSMMGLLIYKRALLTGSQGKVSDTQVTVKVCGPVVFM